MNYKISILTRFIIVQFACKDDTAKPEFNLSSIADVDTYLGLEDWTALKSEYGQNLTILDMRSMEEYQSSHLEGAIHMDPTSLIENFRNAAITNEKQPIVIYGKSIEQAHGNYLALKGLTSQPLYLLLANYSDELEFDSLYTQGIDPTIMDYDSKWQALLQSAKLDAPDPVVVAAPKKKIVPKKKVVKKEEEEGC